MFAALIVFLVLYFVGRRLYRLHYQAWLKFHTVKLKNAIIDIQKEMGRRLVPVMRDVLDVFEVER